MDPETQNMILNVVLVVAIFVAFRYMPRLTAGVPFVDPSELKERLDRGEDTVVIDVRTDGEFVGNLGHVPGALNILAGDLAAKIEAMGASAEELKSEPVYVMCRTENRAPRGARVLKKAGFTNVRIVKGGMSRWNREGFPVEGRG